LFAGDHRTATHSLSAVLFVGLFAAALAANAGRPIARIGLMCAAAYSTHLLLDWLGADNYPPRGIQALWPFSREWFISDIDVFTQTARQHILEPENLLKNIRAVVQEIAILAPMVFGLYLVRVKALAGLATEVARRDHAPQ
jgi:inner membrane protein